MAVDTFHFLFKNCVRPGKGYIEGELSGRVLATMFSTQHCRRREGGKDRDRHKDREIQRQRKREERGERERYRDTERKETERQREEKDIETHIREIQRQRYREKRKLEERGTETEKEKKDRGRETEGKKGGRGCLVCCCISSMLLYVQSMNHSILD